jgi:hypothetical protein
MKTSNNLHPIQTRKAATETLVAAFVCITVVRGSPFDKLRMREMDGCQ